MQIQNLNAIEDVKLFHLDQHRDNRGWFSEIFRDSWIIRHTKESFQINCSFSEAGVLRGLHYHIYQVDYWYVAYGNIQVGLLDTRNNSPTYNHSHMLDMDNRFGLLIPEGVAHGFLALEDTLLVYVVNQYYDPKDEHDIPWDTLKWYSDNPILSERDKQR